MASQHLVERLDLLVEYAPGVADYDQQYQINDHLRGEFLQVVDELFDELNLKHHHQRIDLLEVDLGEIPVSNYRRVMAERLREQLLEMVAKYRIDQVGDFKGSPSKQEKHDPFSQLCYYLTHGRMPWYSKCDNRSELDQLIRDVIDRTLPKLLALIKAQPESLLVERLIYQLRDVDFMQLAKSLYRDDVSQLLHVINGLSGMGTAVSAPTLKLTLLCWMLDGGSSNSAAIALLVAQAATALGCSPDKLIKEVITTGVIDDELIENVVFDDRKVDQAGYLDQLYQDLQSENIASIREYWSLLVEGDENYIRQVFIDLAESFEVRRFVAYHFSDVMLHQLVKILEPVEYLFIEQTVNNAHLFNLKHSDESLPVTMVKPQVWELTLHYLLVERGSRFNKLSYLQYLIRQSARHHNLDYLQYLNAVYDIISSAEHSAVMKRELISLLSDLIENEQGDEQKVKVQRRPQSNLMQFAHNLVSGRFKMDAVQWQQLLSYDAQTIVALLQQYALRSGVISNLCISLDQQQLKSLVTIVEPQEYSVIHQLVEQSRLFHEPLANSRVTVDELTRQVWEISFTYLLIDRGSRFNQKSYLSAVFHGLAARHNISYQQLLTSLDQLISRSQQTLRVGSGFYTLIHDLYLAAQEPQNEVQSLEKRLVTDEVRLYEMYEQLLSYLTTGNRRLLNSVTTPVSALTLLDKSAPWLLKRLFADLRSAGKLVLNYLTRQDDVTLTCLIEYFFKINAGNQEQFSQLSHAIKQYSGQAGERAWFHARILDALLHDQPVDLEAYVAELAPSASISKIASDNQPVEQKAANSKLLLTHSDYLAFVDHFIKQQITTSSGDQQFIYAVRYLLESQPRSLQTFIESAIADKQQWQRLLSVMPESLLIQLFGALRGGGYSNLLQFSELMFSACADSIAGVTLQAAKSLKWLFIYRSLFDGIDKGSSATLMQQLCHFLASEGVETSEDGLVSLANDYLKFLPVSDRQRYLSLFEQLIDLPEAKLTPALANKKQATEPQSAMSDETLPNEDIYIENAGLVIVGSYLPRLFTMLNLTDKGKFISRTHAERACHLIQYLVDKRCDAPEFQLVLNKQLCGIGSGTPIVREIEIKPEEVEAINGLLLGIIQNWKKIGNTSIDGLRESFLQRSGRLQLTDDAWQLKVQSSAYDVLLDYLPWSYTTIKFPWMKRVIYVDW